MRFALLFSYDPAETGPTEGELQAWLDLDAELKTAGVLVSDAGFQMQEHSRIVTVRDGQVSDTAAVNGSPMLAGYYLLDVADQAAAIGWAAKVPTAAYGTVEVRPVVEWEA